MSNISSKAVHASYLDTGLSHLNDFRNELGKYITQNEKGESRKDEKGKEIPFLFEISELYAPSLNHRIESAFPFLKEKHQEILHQLQDLNLKEFQEEQSRAEKEEKNSEAQKYHYYSALLLAFHEMIDNLRNFNTHYIHAPVNYHYSFLLPIYQYSFDELKRRFDLEENDIQINHLKADEKILSTLEAKEEKKGEIFFTCLFLSKREIELYLSQLTGFKRTGEKDETSLERWARHTRQVYSIPRMKLYRQRNRLKANNHSQDLLAMSCLNEISRCPKELFSLLSPENQKKFRIDVGHEDLYDEQEEVLFKRYKDRFEHLCLALLEQEESFKDIRFYVRLGHHDLKDYDKKLINQMEIHRCLMKPRAGFVKLHQFDTSALEEKPYFILNQNKIGIILSDKDVLPDDKNHKNPVADFWLSKNELPALALYAWLYTQQNEDKQKKLQSVKEILEELQKNYLEHKHKKKNPLSNAKKMLQRLDIYLKETEREIAKLEKVQNTKGQEDEFIMKEGDIAMRLAKDMVWLQPTDKQTKEAHKGKVTGANFQALQYELARYSYSKQNLMRYYKDPQVRLVGSNNAHPFLCKINPCTSNTLITYALNYYKEKKLYIQSQQKKVAKGKMNINFYPIRDLRDDYEKGPSQEMPIQIPRKTFSDLLLKEIKIMAPTINRYYAQGETLKFNEAVFNLLKSLYNIDKKEDGPQAFYSWKRKYDYLNQDDEEQLYHDLKEREYRVAKRFKRVKEMKDTEERKLPQKRKLQQIVRREELLRFRSVQDIILFLFARKTLEHKIKEEKDKKNKSNPLLLKNLYAEEKDKVNLLDESFDFTRKDKTLVITGKLKLKDYSRWMGLYNTDVVADFKALLIHSKIKLNICLQYIEDEINNFISNKKEIIIACQAMEQKMVEQLQQNGTPAIMEEEGGYYNFNALIEKYKDEILKTSTDADKKSQLVKNIIDIRNAFSHTSYKKEFKDILGEERIATVIENYHTEKNEETCFISQAIIEWFNAQTTALVKK